MKPIVFSLAVAALFSVPSDLLTTNDWEATCTSQNCYCSKATSSPHPDVTCFVQVVASYDETILNLPPDLVSLKLVCSDSKRPRLQSGGILSRFSLLQSLTIEGCHIAELSRHSFSGLSNLSSISIIDCVIGHMENDAFLPLAELNFLKIVSSGIAFLPDLANLTKLQHLNVSHNEIVRVNMDTSASTGDIDRESPLLNLTVIDLSYNNLSSMPLTLLRSSPQIQQLLLVNNGITNLEIPEDLELKNLTILDVRENLLESVNFPRLAQAYGLEEVRLEGTGQPLQHEGLVHLSQLTEISLTNFDVTDAIWREFNSTSLVRLDLTNNNLSYIDISQLPALRILRLASNNISTIANTTFVHQPDLLLINVSRNNISTLPPGVFHNNSNLRALDLSRNSITSLRSDVFEGLRLLFYLDLSYNSLTTLSYVILKDQASMLFLYLQGNQLKWLPKLSYMPVLNSLNISQNNLTTLTSFQLSGLTALQFLYANDNKLTSLEPELFSATPSVMEVWLHNNQLSNIESFGNHANLQVLRLDDNRLRDFYSVSPFARLPNLKYLFLDGNEFTSVKLHTFPPSLEMLLLDRNQLNTLYSASFDNLPNLKMVSMMRNSELLSIPLMSVNRFGDHHPKPNFFIGFNTFLCDCNMAYMKVIAEDGYSNVAFNKYYPRFSGIEHTVCVTLLDRHSTTPLMDTPLSDFVCSYREPWCDIWCQCCSHMESCGCVLTCPANCDCYHGGSGFKKNYLHIHCNSKNLTFIPNQIPSRATTVRLDGNDFDYLSIASLNHLSDTEILQLNGSKITTVVDGPFDNTQALEILRLEDNYLTEVTNDLFGNLINLKELYLHNNWIKVISPQAFSELMSIKTITLHNNRLVLLESVLQISPSLVSLTLSGNPWACNCDVAKVMLRTIHTIAIADMKWMCCFVYGDINLNGSRIDVFNDSAALSTRLRLEETHLQTENISVLSSMENVIPSGQLTNQGDFPEQDCFPWVSYDFDEFCIAVSANVTRLSAPQSAGISAGLIALIAIIVLLLITAALVVVVMVKHREFQAWAFVKLGVRIFDKKKKLDKDDAKTKAFDAFISYSARDSVFVAQTLVPALEEGDRRYRVCVHYRDFPVGQRITDTIYRAIENSSRTILLLSQNFLESEWCRFEFQTAHHHILREGSHRLVIVIFGDLPEKLVDPDLKMYLKSNTYLKYGDPWFWEKLYFALPDIQDREARGDNQPIDVSRAMRILSHAAENDQNAYEQVQYDRNEDDREDQEKNVVFKSEVYNGKHALPDYPDYDKNAIKACIVEAAMEGVEKENDFHFNDFDHHERDNDRLMEHYPVEEDKKGAREAHYPVEEDEKGAREELHNEINHHPVDVVKCKDDHGKKPILIEDLATVTGTCGKECSLTENGHVEVLENVHCFMNERANQKERYNKSVRADVHSPSTGVGKVFNVVGVVRNLEDEGQRSVDIDKNLLTEGPNACSTLDVDGYDCIQNNSEDDDETCAYYVAYYDSVTANVADGHEQANLGDTDSGLASDGPEEGEIGLKHEVENVRIHPNQEGTIANQSDNGFPGAENDLFLSHVNKGFCSSQSDSDDVASSESGGIFSAESGTFATESNSPISVDSVDIAGVKKSGRVRVDSNNLSSIDSGDLTSIGSGYLASIESESLPSVKFHISTENFHPPQKTMPHNHKAEQGDAGERFTNI